MSLTLSGSGTIGGLVAGGLPDATVTNDELVTMDGAKVTGDIAAAQITSALNASGSAPVYACRAWVNFNGRGTVAIRGSGNVSSITDNGTGDYTVNFTTAMPDTNFCANITPYDDQRSHMVHGNTLPTVMFSTSYLRASIREYSNTTDDATYMQVSIFR